MKTVRCPPSENVCYIRQSKSDKQQIGHGIAFHDDVTSTGQLSLRGINQKSKTIKRKKPQVGGGKKRSVSRKKKVGQKASAPPIKKKRKSPAKKKTTKRRKQK